MKVLPEILTTEVKGYTLVIPSLSVGNVGQLAVDILLATINPEKVADLKHDAILPVVGSDPLDDKSDRLMTACEIFKGKDYLFLQIRSGLVKNGRQEFVNDLLSWAEGLGVGQLVVLSGFSAVERVDPQIVGLPVRYLTNKAIKREELSALKWTELERKQTFPGLTPNEEPNDNDDLFIPGGGLAKKIYLKSMESALPVVELFVFTSEGDNANDAVRMVTFLNEWTKMIAPQKDGRVGLKFPPSWALMFGNSAPAQIF